MYWNYFNNLKNFIPKKHNNYEILKKVLIKWQSWRLVLSFKEDFGNKPIITIKILLHFLKTKNWKVLLKEAINF